MDSDSNSGSVRPATHALWIRDRWRPFFRRAITYQVIQPRTIAIANVSPEWAELTSPSLAV